MILWAKKNSFFFICLLSFLFNNTSQAQESLNMSSNLHNDPSIKEKIIRVENGLMSAIGILGKPISKKNLLKAMKEMNIPGASIAVINEGQIEWTKTYGVLSSTTDQPVNPQTCFQAGSVSKPVAAFAILTLVNQRILDLDEDVNDKLTSWKIPNNEFTSIKKVTLRHLLSHTSGLSVIGFDGYTKNEQIPTITQTLDGVKPANNPPVRVEFVPGSKMSYSGGAYNVAQQLVEDVTKIPFSQFTENTLLNPLKMNNSTFRNIEREGSSNIAYAHPTKGIPMEGGWKTYPESAAAGLWTTPTDLAKWLIEIQDGLTTKNESKFLSKDLLIDMVTPQVVVHGLGPVINGDQEQLELSFKGRTDGFSCGFVSFPHLKQGAVVMINAGNELAFVDAVLRSIAHEYQWPSHNVKMKKTINLPIEALDKYVGRYGWNGKPNDIYDLFVFKENDQLFWKIGNASNPNKLYPEAKNQFFVVDSGYDVVFEEIDGAITALTIIVQAGFEREFRKF